jgi:hypothetical protein
MDLPVAMSTTSCGNKLKLVRNEATSDTIAMSNAIIRLGATYQAIPDLNDP